VYISHVARKFSRQSLFDSTPRARGSDHKTVMATNPALSLRNCYFCHKVPIEKPREHALGITYCGHRSLICLLYIHFFTYSQQRVATLIATSLQQDVYHYRSYNDMENVLNRTTSLQKIGKFLKHSVAVFRQGLPLTSRFLISAILTSG
jgi:hypothetical protein